MSDSVLGNWARLVKSEPCKPVLFDPKGDAVSLSELDNASSALEQKWKDEGLGARRMVGLRMQNSVGWMTAFLACLKMDAVAVPLDPGLQSDEVEQTGTDLRVQAIWDGESLKYGSALSPRVFKNPDITLCKLTSGSTGKPKAIFFSNTEMMSDGRQLMRAMDFGGNDINLGSIPWGHSYGLGNIVYPLLMEGMAVAWTETPFPREMGAVCKKVGCTVFPSVPTIIRALARSDCEVSDFSSLQLVVAAGARLDPQVAAAFFERFGKKVHNFYGSSETGGICFDRDGDAALTGRSVGTLIEGVSMLRGRGRRFYISSPAVCRFGRKGMSDGAEGKVLMADSGYLDENGELVLESRAKNLLKIGARRISSVDIEKRLRSIAGVHDAVVFAIERDGETAIGAAIESSLGREVLGVAIRETVPLRLRPKRWLAYESFPVTSRGKTDIRQIKRDLG